jgi:hypothetical protein
MSIFDIVQSARDDIDLFLQKCEHKSSNPLFSLQNDEAIRIELESRKAFWNCIQTSKLLSKVSTDVNFCGNQQLNELNSSKDLQQLVQLIELRSSLTNLAEVPPLLAPVVNKPLYLKSTTNISSSSKSSHKQELLYVDDRLSMAGFASIKEKLEKLKQACSNTSCDCYMELGEAGIREGWSSVVTNPAYCYENNPAPGWRREVTVRMSGKTRGKLNVHYVTPDKLRRFRNRQDLHAYLQRTHSASLGPNFIDRFDFQTAFCLCHGNEDHTRSFLECSFGLAGCNQWLHPECVGLGTRSEQELALLPKVVCCYCAAYLDGLGQLEEYQKSGAM